MDSGNITSENKSEIHNVSLYGTSSLFIISLNWLCSGLFYCFITIIAEMISRLAERQKNKQLFNN